MCPIVDLDYDNLFSRMNFLLEAALFEEAVVERSQAIERMLHRVVIG